MNNIHNFTLFLSLSAILIVTPGPDLIFVLTKGISNGKKAGLLSAAGVSCGILVHTLFAALGLSIVLRTSALAFFVIKILGVIYLVFLGIKSIISKTGFSLDNEKETTGTKLFTQGLISNTLNPKVALFFLAFLPQFITNTHHTNYSPVPFIILGLVFALMTISFLAFLGYYSGFIGKYLQKKKSLSTIIQKISGAILVMLGIRLAFARQK